MFPIFSIIFTIKHFYNKFMLTPKKPEVNGMFHAFWSCIISSHKLSRFSVLRKYFRWANYGDGDEFEKVIEVQYTRNVFPLCHYQHVRIFIHINNDLDNNIVRRFEMKSLSSLKKLYLINYALCAAQNWFNLLIVVSASINAYIHGT